MERVATTSGEGAAIQDALARYEVALNGGDVDAVLDAFAPNGVFMAPAAPAAVGAAAIRAAYACIFDAIGFDTVLHVDEVVQVSPDWAFARTHSAGVVIVHADGSRLPDANHELFVLQRTEGAPWRIARYAFASTLPPR